MRMALFEPDMPGNVGTIIRLAACMAVPVDIIEPCGFPFGDRALKRAGMDYVELASVHRHNDWDTFRDARPERLVLLTAHGDLDYADAAFDPDDILLLGRESAGTPPHVHGAAALRVRIPLARERRSLNVAVAAAMVLGEALRQTGSFPR
jgi:tRNA (cytidine/uridine-2'-O-)-methyltransferase